MKSLNYILISVHLIYFFTLLTGLYGPQLVSDYALQIQDKIEITNEANEEFQMDSSMLQNDNYGQINDKLAIVWSWQPGLFQNLVVHATSLKLFNDTLLENDSRPTKFFDELNRSYAATITRLVLTVFWCIGLFLLLISLFRNAWFYKPMSTIIFLISIFTLMLILSTDRKIQINRFAGISYYHVALASFEFAMVFLTITVLLIRTLPYKKLKLDFEFMDHLRIPATKIPIQIQNIIKTTFHIVLIIISGTIIANLFLLPLYKIQTSFQGIFALVLSFIIGALALWYIKAYVGLVREKTQKKDWLSGFAFLGYRFLKNTLFIGTVIVIVAIVLTVIVVLSAFNTEVLQFLNLIPIQESL